MSETKQSKEQQLTAQLADSEQRFRSVVEYNRDAMLILDSSSRVNYANRAGAELYGVNTGELLGKQLDFSNLSEVETQVTIDNKLFGDITVEARCTTIKWQDQQAALITLRNISERKEPPGKLHRYAQELAEKSQELIQLNATLLEQQKALEDSNQQLEILLHAAGEGILGINLAGTINFANPKACRLLNLSQQAILQHNILSFFKQSADVLKGQSITQLGEKEQRCFWQTADKKPFFAAFSCNATTDSQGQTAGAVVMFQDISERKHLEDELLHLANFDPLTKLANRAHFHLSLTEGIERQKRSQKTLAVLYLDMDHFKYINDSLGHHTGDMV
ncbi:MAG: PAS domain S-box protein, partial [Psychrosphaera sp.]|nr:PAS domain S-box protein [Psychrosphaera sp.]